MRNAARASPARGRGGGGRARSPGVSKSPVRSPQRRKSSLGSASGTNSTAATTAAQTPVNVRKPAAQMRREIGQLEGILKERQLFFAELEEEEGRLIRVLGADADDILATQAGSDEGKAADVGEAPAMSEEEEIQHLAQRNAQLLRELKALTDAERKYSNDPRVLDKRNEVNLVKMQIKQVEKDIQTLQTVKKRRDGALREIDRSEQVARKVRGQQREVMNELRTELKALMEQLRAAEKADVDAHERHARLQEQVKLAVTEKGLEELKSLLKKQEGEIKELTVSEATWKVRKEGARDENQRLLAKEQRECALLEREVERLRGELAHKDAELRKSYQPVGRANVLR